MQTEVSGSQRTARVAALKGFGVGALVAGLIALMAVAAFRETAKPKPQQVAANTEVNHVERPAVTAEEEAYARALWPIHAQVKQDAVKMTFAGLAYKMGDIKRAAVKERVAPLTPMFDSAVAALNKLQPPASMRVLHGEYLEAIKLYRDASVTMIKVAVDGRDAHLLEAQAMSEKASGLTLKVGETLWPGEFKPN
jgi:hypothetical protein